MVRPFVEWIDPTRPGFDDVARSRVAVRRVEP
jgi:hypothetical protein